MTRPAVAALRAEWDELWLRLGDTRSIGAGSLHSEVAMSSVNYSAIVQIVDRLRKLAVGAALEAPPPKNLTQQDWCDLLYAMPDGAMDEAGHPIDTDNLPDDAPEVRHFEAPMRRDYGKAAAVLARILGEAPPEQNVVLTGERRPEEWTRGEAGPALDVSATIDRGLAEGLLVKSDREWAGPGLDETALAAAERAYWTDNGVSRHNLGVAILAYLGAVRGVVPAPPPEGELERLRALLNTPEIEDFDKAVPLEAAHQVERWGVAHDGGKEVEDWFWLVGYLAGKALASAKAGNIEKAKHHCISTAAALRNWHAHLRSGVSVMRPGIEPPAPFGHQMGRPLQDGYATCARCGARENTAEAARFCPGAVPAPQEGP